MPVFLWLSPALGSILSFKFKSIQVSIQVTYNSKSALPFCAVCSASASPFLLGVLPKTTCHLLQELIIIQRSISMSHCNLINMDACLTSSAPT